MSPVKVAVVGAGRMGLTHYAIINAHPDVRVCAVVEPSTPLRTVLGKHVAAPMFADFSAMLKAAEPDALLVSTPPASHVAILTEALQRRLHAFVEKPCTLSAADARGLARRYDAAGLVHQVGYVNRFNDVFQECRRLTQGGAIGKVIRYKTEMLSRTVTAGNTSSGWRQSREAGGGVTFEMATHAIDLAAFLVGTPSRVCGSQLTKVYSTAVDDIVSTTLVHPSGLSGSLFVNWSDDSVRKPTNTVELLGTQGKLIVNQHGLQIYRSQPSDAFALAAGWTTKYITDLATPVPFYLRGNEYTRQLWHFIARIQDRSEPSVCSMHDAADTLAVIECIASDASASNDLR